MAKTYSKINLSSMHVLKTLQTLLHGDYSMQELIEKMNKEENEAIFNNSVMSKYINTCRYCGINIEKYQNKYYVTNMPFGLKISPSDLTLFEHLQNIVKNEFSKRTNKIFNKFLDKLNRYSNQEITKVDKNMYEISSEVFENAIFEKRRIKILTKTGEEFICIPLKIVNNKGKKYFNIYHAEKEKLINFEKVSLLKVLSEKFIKNFNDISVVFVLKGELAKRYCLRENERLIQTCENGDIVISNKNEVKEILLSRLMRYDDKCEILNPKSYREDMKTIIENALKNYGV